MIRPSHLAFISLAAALAVTGCGTTDDNAGAAGSSSSVSSSAKVSSVAVSSQTGTISSQTAISSSTPVSSTDQTSSTTVSSNEDSSAAAVSSIIPAPVSSAQTSSVSIFPDDGQSSSEASSFAPAPVSSATATSTAQQSSVSIFPDTGASSSISIIDANTIPYQCEDSSENYPQIPFPYQTSVKSGTEGNILYDCKFMSQTPGFAIEPGVSELTITQIIREDTYFNIIDGRVWQGNITYDYKAATIRYVGSAEDLGSLDCVETFKPQLPVTLISDAEDLTDKMYDLFFWFGTDKSDPDFISTTCPNWFYDENGGNSDDATSSDVRYTNNYVLTDSNAKTHNISIYTKVTR